MVKTILHYLWRAFIAFLSIASFVEVIFGFLPISKGSETYYKLFFMGITLIGFFYLIVDYMIRHYVKNYNLSKEIEKGLMLSQEDRYEASYLLEIESDLGNAFNSKKMNGYHIVIFTACFDEEDKFLNVIWKNINKKCKYLYITPNSDQEFINLLVYSFSKKKHNKLYDVYNTVVSNISHVCEKDFFNALPEKFDMCIYCKDVNNNISSLDAKGFIRVQNENVYFSDEKYAFYYPLSQTVINRIIHTYSEKFDEDRILEPYMSLKIERKNSPIHGEGLFCKKDEVIKKGEILIIKGGFELHKDQMYASSSIDSYLAIGDDLFLAAKTAEQEQYIKIYINHSCNPNVGMLNERTFIAMREINSGEEITIDYAFVDNEDYSFDCKCGDPNCRKRITGFDWKNTHIQEKYKEYFSPYLKKHF
jgi:hypothetical protein